MSAPRPETSSIPDEPGAYLFRDPDGRVVYVGKARSLRKRLASYWGKPLHPRTRAMVDAATSVEWIVASGEVDALMLEYNLIQRHRPRSGHSRSARIRFAGRKGSFFEAPDSNAFATHGWSQTVTRCWTRPSAL